MESKKIKKNCKQCNKEFHVYNYNKDKKYCSRECFSTKIETKCSTCNKPVSIWRSHKAEHNYCNRECYNNRQDSKITISCDHCGLKLRRIKPYINPKNFCNKKCMDASGAKNFKDCYNCNKEITTKRARTAYSLGFCSDSCIIDYALNTYGEDHGLTFKEYICKQCDNIFHTFTSDRIFCSRDCKGKYHGKEKHHMWVEDRSKVYNPDPDRGTKEYKAWRKYILKRDEYKCQICGIGRDQDILCTHHIKKFSLYKDLRTDTENGILLCKHRCHVQTLQCEELFEDLFYEMVDLINRGELETKREYYKNVFLTIVQNKHDL